MLEIGGPDISSLVPEWVLGFPVFFPRFPEDAGGGAAIPGGGRPPNRLCGKALTPIGIWRLNAREADSIPSLGGQMPRGEKAIAERLASLKTELAPDLEVIRLLGTGRMAEVYLARQASLDRLVAVKVLSRRISKDESAEARFNREAKAVAALETPHAVSVYRSGHLEDGAPFLVMQYVRGGTLEDRLEAEGPLPEPEARKILASIAEALAAAHERDPERREEPLDGAVLAERTVQRGKDHLAAGVEERLGALERSRLRDSVDVPGAVLRDEHEERLVAMPIEGCVHAFSRPPGNLVLAGRPARYDGHDAHACAP